MNYNRQEIDGQLVAVVTAAFWNKGQYLTGAFPWEDVVHNGAHIVNVELTKNVEDAMEEWRDAYDMSVQQTDFVLKIFHRRVENFENAVALRRAEVEWLRSISESEEALEASVAAFTALGISVEHS